jgi:hypothetical protein
VVIVGEMAIRMSFASRGSERREWRRSGLTRTSTTLPMVYLSLCADAKGQGECEDSSGFGRVEGCWRCCWPSYIGQTGAGLDRQNFGFHARTDARFGSGGHGSGGWSVEFAGG